MPSSKVLPVSLPQMTITPSQSEPETPEEVVEIKSSADGGKPMKDSTDSRIRRRATMQLNIDELGNVESITELDSSKVLIVIIIL